VNPDVKISIITVCYNSEDTIQDTIESVLTQDYPNVEYIIIDGKSHDSTISIIHQHKEYISKFVSEPDDGIYDAMNKGIFTATGEIVGILNSDDVYSNPTILSSIVHVFSEKSVDCVYGDIAYVNEKDLKKPVRIWKSSTFLPNSFSSGWHPPHPSFFVRRQIYELFGSFDLNFEISADFELMLRFLEKEKISSSYIPQSIVNMRTGGVSNSGIFNIIKGNINILRAFKKNNIPHHPLYPILRMMMKLRQFQFST